MTGSGAGGQGGGYGSVVMLLFSIGYWLYSLFNPEKSERPKPEELTINNFYRNAPVPLVYGTNKVTGTCIYVGNVRADYVEAGGKGMFSLLSLFIGGSLQQESPGWKYSADFAIGLCEGPTYGIGKIYLNNINFEDLWDYFGFAYYQGLSDATIDTSVQSVLGDDAIPWRYTSYMFLSGTMGAVNQIPSVSAEVIGLLSNSQYYNSAYSLVVFDHDYGNPPYPPLVYYCGLDSEPLEYLGNGTYKYGATRVLNGTLASWHTINILTNNEPDDQCSVEKLLSYSFPTGYTQWDGNQGYYSPYVGRYIPYIFSGGDFAMHYGIAFSNESAISGGDIFTCSRHDPTTFRPNRVMSAGGTRYYWVESNGDMWTLDSQNPYNDYMTYDHMHSRDPGRPVTNETALGWVDCVFVGDRYYDSGQEWYSHGFVQSTTTWRCTPLILNPYGIDFSFTPATLGSVSQVYIYNYKFLYYIVYNNVEVFLYKWDLRTGEHKLLRKISDDCQGPADPSHFYHCAWTGNSERTIDSFIKFRGAIYLMSFPWHDSYGVPHIYNTPNFKCYKIIPYTDNVIFLSNLVVKYSWYGYQPDQDPNHFNYTTHYNWLVTDDKLYFEADGGARIALYEIITSPNTEKDTSPIEVAYDFLTNERYGMAIPTSLIDGSPYTYSATSSWYNENTYCYGPVTTETGEVECRFLYSNTFDQMKKGFDFVQEVLQTCRGFIYYCDGKIKVHIEKGTELPVIYFGNEEVTLLAHDHVAGDKDAIYLEDTRPDNYWSGDIGYAFYIDGYGSMPYGVGGYGGTDIQITTQFGINTPLFTTFIVLSSTASCLTLIENMEYEVPLDTPILLKKDNFKKDSFQYQRKPDSERMNQLHFEYIRRDEDYRIDILDLQDDYNIEFTGEVRELSFTMNGIKRDTQARRMLTFLSDYNSVISWTCNFDTDIIGMLLCIGNIVGVTDEINGWYGKLFRVITMEELEDYEHKLSLLEYEPTIYHDEYIAQTPTYTNNYDNICDQPDQVINLDAIEDKRDTKIWIGFSKPITNNTWWVGAVIWHYNPNTELWENIGTSYWNTFTSALASAVTSTQTTIPFSTTHYDTDKLQSSGIIWLDNEMIYYGSIDDVNHQFTYCERGYKDTLAVSHSSGTCVYLRNSLFYYEYDPVNDIAKTHIFKAVSITNFGIMADGDLAPTTSVTIEGSYLLPYPVGSLILYEL